MGSAENHPVRQLFDVKESKPHSVVVAQCLCCGLSVTGQNPKLVGHVLGECRLGRAYLIAGVQAR